MAYLLIPTISTIAPSRGKTIFEILTKSIIKKHLIMNNPYLKNMTLLIQHLFLKQCTNQKQISIL